MNIELQEKALNRSESLSGKRWIPYSYDMWNLLFLRLNDEDALYLLEDRRKYLFSDFVRSEPQKELIIKLLIKNEIKI